MNRLILLLFLLVQYAKPAGLSDFPTASGVYYRQGDAMWIPLQPASMGKMTTKGMELFVETGGYNNLGMSLVCRGAKAVLRIPAPKPTFFVRASGSPQDAMLIRLSQKKDTRFFDASSANVSVENKAGFKPNDMRRVAVTEYPDHSFTLTPEKDLNPGEYLLVFGSTASGFDFGIDKTKLK
jgi:hypothetical protein